LEGAAGLREVTAMKRANLILAVVAAVLFVASALSYRASVARAERFERGQKLLPNLNPDEVATIAVTKGEETVTLKRQEEGFVVAERDGYPAANEAVNRFLRDLLDLALEREVGKGAELEKELELEPPGPETLDLALKNAAGADMVRLKLGKPSDEGGGRFVERLGAEGGVVYLTSGNPYLSTDAGSFLKKEILDVPATEVVRVAGADFTLEKGDGEDFRLAGAAGRELKASEVNRLKAGLTALSFQEVFPADDPQVAGLDFAESLRFDLADQSGYLVATARLADRRFLRIRGFSTVDRVAIGMDESEEELKAKADTLTKVDAMQEFNAFHGSWVYELPSYKAEALELARKDLLGSG
jgi:hypothetical protein